ncbi:MAG TPA: hypothetical protein VJ418_04975 [Streptosporangiaceae bacterium]|nr:hypothetical protein [Streptosporangiaceae bacterium]
MRDGYVAVRGAFDAGTAAACREVIWAALGERGVREDDPATWPPLVHIDSLGGGPFAAAGTSPVLAAAYDELIGPGRWAPQVHAGGTVVVRFPSQDRANAGYHIEGSYDGPGGYWVNVQSRARAPGAAVVDRRRPGRRADPAGLRISSACRAVPSPVW